MKNTKRLVTVKQIAETISVPERQVRRLASEGRIPAYRFSRKVLRFDPDAVLKSAEVATAAK